MMRTLFGLLAVLLTASSAQAAGYSVRFTPPDPRYTTCQILIGSTVIAQNVLPAYPCATDPANVCAPLPLTLAPGHYGFQLVCATGEIRRSNGIRVNVP